MLTQNSQTFSTTTTNFIWRKQETKQLQNKTTSFWQNKTDFLSDADFIIRMLYKYSYEVLPKPYELYHWAYTVLEVGFTKLVNSFFCMVASDNFY